VIRISGGAHTSISSSAALDERLYALQDANWNVTAIVDDAGNVQERYRYAAYGMPTFLQPDFAPRSPNQSDFEWETLYAGYRFDVDSGLYCVRHRYLNSSAGNWSSRDNVSYLDGVNLYGYAQFDPTDYTDPSGKLCRIAVHCGPVVRVVTLGTHCGLTIETNSGFTAIDGSGGNILQIITVAGQQGATLVLNQAYAVGEFSVSA